MNKNSGFSGKHRHYLSKTPAWNSWNAMLTRCMNPNASNFIRYGGRGISIYPPWLDFAIFFSDMGERPEGTTLGRIDNNGNYAPDNCQWTRIEEQQNNKSNSLFLTINGKTQTASQWAKEQGIPIATVHTRLRRGWSNEDAISRRNYRA